MSNDGWGNQIRPLTHSEFEEIRALARDHFGLDLRPGKEQLVSARLGKQLRKLGLSTFGDYCSYVRSDTSGTALAEMIDALTTNYTSFLREPAHFEFLRSTVIPKLRHRERIDVWSAACATGEEPYSIAISALEELGGAPRPSIRILATDISTRALEAARMGTYQSERLAGLPAEQLRRYFLKGTGRWRGWYRVRPAVREVIDFQRLNLNEALPALPLFALIFCRNVMIYFDRNTQEQLVRKLAARLEPGGYLFTGHSESLLKGSHSLEYVSPAVYRKPQEGAPPERRGMGQACRS